MSSILRTQRNWITFVKPQSKAPSSWNLEMNILKAFKRTNLSKTFFNKRLFSHSFLASGSHKKGYSELRDEEYIVELNAQFEESLAEYLKKHGNKMETGRKNAEEEEEFSETEEEPFDGIEIEEELEPPEEKKEKRNIEEQNLKAILKLVKQSDHFIEQLRLIDEISEFDYASFLNEKMFNSFIEHMINKLSMEENVELKDAILNSPAKRNFFCTTFLKIYDCKKFRERVRPSFTAHKICEDRVHGR